MDFRHIGDAFTMVFRIAAFGAFALIGALITIVLMLFGVATFIAIIPVCAFALMGAIMAWCIQ